MNSMKHLIFHAWAAGFCSAFVVIQLFTGHIVLAALMVFFVVWNAYFVRLHLSSL
jgi:hypothetical protein